MEKIETLTIDELIETLVKIKSNLITNGIKNVGKIKVFLSSDTEGNSIGTLKSGNVLYSFDFLMGKDSKCGDSMIIYPYEENVDIFNF